MQINLFAWIVKIVSLKLAAGGYIIMVVKNKIFLVKEITEVFFFFFLSRERKQRRKNCGHINRSSGKQSKSVNLRNWRKIGVGVGWGKLSGKTHVQVSQQVPKRQALPLGTFKLQCLNQVMNFSILHCSLPSKRDRPATEFTWSNIY